ncbi:MAG: site-specific integrase [Acidobacteriaceae bacterium]
MFAEYDPIARMRRDLADKLAAKHDGITLIEDALEQWLATKSKKDVATQSKYRTAKKKIALLASQRQITRIDQFNPVMIQEWVNAWGPESVYWKMGVRTQGALLERVKDFFRFTVRMGWVATSPAAGIESITEPVGTRHTSPLSKEQYRMLLAATTKYDADMRPDDRMGKHLRAIIETERWCGIRIGDILKLHRKSIREGKLKLRTKKTGESVFVLVPVHVEEQLNALPNIGKYYFWTGKSSYKSLVCQWERKMRRLQKYLNWRFHSHQLRDTFAVNHLEHGVELADVSSMLGHKNTAITEKYYSPWTAGRQNRIEEIMRRSYALQTLPV